LVYLLNPLVHLPFLDGIVEVGAVLVIIHLYRCSADMAAEVRRSAVVVTLEFVAAQIKADMVAFAIVVKVESRVRS
jgi:hypothetical protein